MYIRRRLITIWPLLSLVVLGLGVFLRTRQYLAEHSIWMDEASVVINAILVRSKGLFQAQAVNQATPVGLIAVSRLQINLFGFSEIALRLLPYLFSICSVLLFYRLSVGYLKNAAALFALFCFCLNSQLVFYAGDLKQYTADVFFSVLLTLLALRSIREHFSNKTIIQFSISGAISLWFSSSAIIVLAAQSLVLMVLTVRRDRFGDLTRKCLVLVLPPLLAILPILKSYFLASANNKFLVEYWQQGFLPAPLFSFASFTWNFTNSSRIVQFWFASAGYIAVGLCLFGMFFEMQKKRYERFFLLVSPLALCWMAAALQKYPIADRLSLFLVPFAILLLARGLEGILSNLSGLLPPRKIAVLGLLAAFGINYPSILNSLQFRSHQEELAPALRYFESNVREGDSLLVSALSQGPLTFYAFKDGMSCASEVMAQRINRDLSIGDGQTLACFVNGIRFSLILSGMWHKEPKYITQDIVKASAVKRAWILFYHLTTPETKSDIRQIAMGELAARGRQIDYFKAPGVELCLYKFEHK